MKTFGIFAKQPLPGRVKTRLATDIGPESAARFYEAFVRDSLHRFRSTGERRVIGTTPQSSAADDWFRAAAAGNYELWPQPESSLGDRMLAYFREHLRAADDRAILIGSDSPTIPLEFVEQAFEYLSSIDCVIGPASDGGYYLIGLRTTAVRERLFAEIEWSGCRVLETTAARLAELTLTVALLPVWYDVDSVTDLQVLRGHLKALQLTGVTEWPHTCQLCWPSEPR